jgi:hypothetical protein
MMDNDLSFFDNMKVFTYSKIDLDIMPCTLETVRDLYPHKPDFSKFSHYKLPVDRLNPDFMRLLDSAGLDVKHAEIFYRPGNGPSMDAFIHTDGHRVIPGFAKINYIIGEGGNTMKWWRPLQVTVKNEMLTAINTKYLKFDESECQLLDQTDMIGLYVVNAGIPHSVSMIVGDVGKPRICISVTPKPKDSIKMNIGCHEANRRLTHAIKNFSQGL